MNRQDLGRGAWVELFPGFVEDHALLMERLADTLPLQSEIIRVFGRDVATPRLTSWHGDSDCSYRYSGRTFAANPWTEELATLRDQLTKATGIRYNSVLANYYRSGSDSMGAHSDNEPELGPHRDDIRIASISLGARRRFVLSSRRRDGHRPVFELGAGDLLVMGGTTQRYYRHQVPKTARRVGKRLNLTFRLIVAGNAPKSG